MSSSSPLISRKKRRKNKDKGIKEKDFQLFAPISRANRVKSDTQTINNGGKPAAMKRKRKSEAAPINMDFTDKEEYKSRKRSRSYAPGEMADMLALKATEELVENSKYNWITKESLVQLMERTDIKHTCSPRNDSLNTEWSIKPSLPLLHACWATKPNISPSESLIKGILPLECSSKTTNWMMYVVVKSARVAHETEYTQFPPQMNVSVSFNEGVSNSTESITSWDPAWNETFYFPVKNVKKDKVNLALYLTRARGKDTKEGGCIGVCDIPVISYFLPYGYYAPNETWQVLLDPNTHVQTESFISLVVQLVPEYTESFTDIKSHSIRVQLNSEQYIEQFGDHIKKNKSV